MPEETGMASREAIALYDTTVSPQDPPPQTFLLLGLYNQTHIPAGTER